MDREILLINEIDKICEYSIPAYQKISLIFHLIKDWREEEATTK